MKVALDTNLLVYAEGFRDAGRRSTVNGWARALTGRLVVPAQVLGELYNVLVRKAGRERTVARRIVQEWATIGEVAAADWAVFQDAMQLAADHDLQIWDAVIIATAQSADCPLLLSEDMQHGFAWKSLTVVNPFAEPAHPLLQAALASSH